MEDASQGSVVERVGFGRGILSLIRSKRGKREGVILGIAAAVAISSVLMFLLPLDFITYILVALIGFALPYYMGVKKVLHLLIYGLCFIVVIGAVFTGALSHYVFVSPTTVSQEPGHNSTAGYFFGKGQVSPVDGNGNTVFAYTVQFYHPAPASNFSVYVLSERLFAGTTVFNTTMSQASSQTLAGGAVLTTYVYNTTVPSNNIYIFEFKANVSGSWVNSTVAISPRTATESSLFMVLLGPSIEYVVLSVGTLFLGIALIVLLIRQTRLRREALAKARETELNRRKEKIRGRGTGAQEEKKAHAAKGEKFICTSCGTEVERDATVCPKCGEKFEQ